LVRQASKFCLKNLKLVTYRIRIGSLLKSVNSNLNLVFIMPGVLSTNSRPGFTVSMFVQVGGEVR
jgi:hypothetical protein